MDIQVKKKPTNILLIKIIDKFIKIHQSNICTLVFIKSRGQRTNFQLIFHILKQKKLPKDKHNADH